LCENGLYFWNIKIFTMSYNTLKLLHLIAVNLFLLIYLIKTILLFSSTNTLQKFTQATKVLEMIISTIFLVTGVWLFIELGGIKLFQIVKLVLIIIAIPIAVIGFKKQNKGLALLSLLLIVGSYGLAEMAKKKPYLSPSKESIINTTSGGELYAKHCVACHGNDGKKMLAGAYDLSASTKNQTEIVAIITNGKESMQAYGNLLSASEIDEVSKFVLSLRN
jgi:mono/diheme cytochrome c family protein